MKVKVITQGMNKAGHHFKKGDIVTKYDSMYEDEGILDFEDKTGLVQGLHESDYEVIEA